MGGSAHYGRQLWLASGHGQQLRMRDVVVLVGEKEQRLVVVQNVHQRGVLFLAAADAPVGRAVGEQRGQQAVVLVMRVHEDEGCVNLCGVDVLPVSQQVMPFHVALCAVVGGGGSRVT